MTKYLNTQSLLWLALVLAMIGSLKHLTAVFASVDGDYLFGLIQAVAVDAGLFALAYSIRQRKAANKPTWFVWCGVALFSLISVFGNYIYGQTALGGNVPGWIVWLKPIVLAASLPVLVIYLSEIVSDNREHAKTEVAKPAAKPKAEVATRRVASGKLSEVNAEKVAAKESKLVKMRELLTGNPDVSNTELATALEVSRATVRNYRQELNGVAK